MSGILWTWFATVASGLTGLRTVWMWAFLEAIILPLPPEVLLIPLALVHPQEAFALALSAVIGSLLGGLISYLLGKRFREGAVVILKQLPGVNPNRVIWASSMIERRGAPFIAISPWLVLPYKITSVASGHLQIVWWRYFLAGAVGRGTRLMGVTLAAAAVGKGSPIFIQSNYLVVLLLTYGVVGGILWLIQRWLIRRWLS